MFLLIHASYLVSSHFLSYFIFYSILFYPILYPLFSSSSPLLCSSVPHPLFSSSSSLLLFFSSPLLLFFSSPLLLFSTSPLLLFSSSLQFLISSVPHLLFNYFIHSQGSERGLSCGTQLCHEHASGVREHSTYNRGQNKGSEGAGRATWTFVKTNQQVVNWKDFLYTVIFLQFNWISIIILW